MIITAELSLYPLGGAPLEKILGFIDDVRQSPRLEVVVNQLSTQIRGELADVLAAVEQALARSFTAGGSQVLVAKFLNADLPIASPPDLERPR